jgi:ABC-type multidrug transport system ATPase subunit
LFAFFCKDPYNRRLIWTIIRKMKEAGKCIILTTHFLEEADVLSDRIAVMTSGRLQANGTPDFLKNQIGISPSALLFFWKL